jgi:hypothetical protein
MQRDPERRWKSAAEMAAALEAILAHVEDGSATATENSTVTSTGENAALRRSWSRSRLVKRASVWLGASALVSAALWYAASASMTRPSLPAATPPPRTLAAALARPSAEVERPAHPTPATPAATAAALRAPALPSRALLAADAGVRPRAAKRRAKSTEPPPAAEEELPPLLPR